MRKILLLLSTFALCHCAIATVYFRDGINYSSGSVLGNDTPWSSPQSAITVAGGSLTYSNLTSVSPGANMIQVATNTGLVYSYATFTNAATNGNVYVSFMIKYTAFSGSTTRSGLLQTGNTPAALATTNDPMDFVDDTLTGGFKLGVRARGSTSYYVTNSFSPLQVGTTYLVVMRYKFSDGSASMWINPPIGGSEPASADATSISGAGVVADLHYIYFRAGSSQPGYQVDNIQIASTWQEVTTTPLSAVKLVVTLPGQTFTSGSGNSGTVSNQTSGVPFNIKLSAVESDGVTLATIYSGTKTISYSGPGGKPVYTTNVTFTAGQASGIATTLNAGQTTNITATDGFLVGVPSSSLAVAAVFQQLYDAGPGLFSGENLILTNLTGSKIYIWSSTNTGISVSNWTLVGQMGDQPLNDGTGNSRFALNLNPTVSPTYYIASDSVSSPYHSPQFLSSLSTDDSGDYILVNTNAPLGATGIFSLPTALPSSISISSSGLISGQGFQLTFNGTNAQPYSFSILASSNLTNWDVIYTGMASNLPVLFSDPAATNTPRRFYKVRAP